MTRHSGRSTVRGLRSRLKVAESGLKKVAASHKAQKEIVRLLKSALARKKKEAR